MLNSRDKYNEIREEIVQTEQKLRYSEYKIWIILFLSSFLLFLWSETMQKSIYYQRIFIIPVILNSSSWLFWIILNNFISYRKSDSISSLRSNFKELAEIDNEFHYMYYRWDFLLVKLQKQSQLVRIIEVIVAIELAIVPIFWLLNNLMF